MKVSEKLAKMKFLSTGEAPKAQGKKRTPGYWSLKALYPKAVEPQTSPQVQEFTGSRLSFKAFNPAFNQRRKQPTATDT